MQQINQVDWNEPELVKWLGNTTREGTIKVYRNAFWIYAQFTGMTAKSLIDEAIEDFKKDVRQRQDVVKNRLLTFYRWLKEEYPRKSGGNIRRFKEFIRKCLVKQLVLKKPSITKEDVAKWIELSDVISSLDMQLAELWPISKESRALAAEILDYVDQHNEVSQTALVEHFFLSEETNINAAKTSCSRYLKQLTKKYLKRRRVSGQWLYSLKHQEV